MRKRVFLINIFDFFNAVQEFFVVFLTGNDVADCFLAPFAVLGNLLIVGAVALHPLTVIGQIGVQELAFAVQFVFVRGDVFHDASCSRLRARYLRMYSRW